MCVEAAVELLVAHGVWLWRGDFVDGYVEWSDGLVTGEAMAWVDWEAATAAVSVGRLASSASEQAMLEVAASLAGAGRVDVGAAASVLDRDNLVLVAAAVLYAGGHGHLAVAFQERGGW